MAQSSSKLLIRKRSPNLSNTSEYLTADGELDCAGPEVERKECDAGKNSFYKM